MTTFLTERGVSIPAVTEWQMREVDRLAEEQLGLVVGRFFGDAYWVRVEPLSASGT